MRNIKIWIGAGVLFFAMTQQTFASYTIDGNISDWGVNINVNAARNKYYLDTHLPSGGNDIDYLTEDNADKFDGIAYVGPAQSPGNRYDAEAMYMDNDYNYLYLAIVTGTSPGEIELPPGDIFLDTGYYQDPLSSFFNNNKYGFGIDIKTGNFYSVNSWIASDEGDPWKIGANKTLLGAVDFIYTPNAVKSHYVMEAKIPLYFMSLENKAEADVWAHWTMECGNDVLNLKGDIDNNVVPEPATMSLMLLGGAGLGLVRRKKSKV